MRFLVDANMPRSTLALLASLGHVGEHARDIGLGHAPDSDIAACARSTGAVIVTRDVDFSDIRNYPPHEFQGLIVMRMPDDAVAQTIVNLLERFLKKRELVDRLPRHLVILESDRVRFRPAFTVTGSERHPTAPTLRQAVSLSSLSGESWVFRQRWSFAARLFQLPAWSRAAIQGSVKVVSRRSRAAKAEALRKRKRGEGGW